MLRGRIELPRLTSRALAGNRLGDPVEREVLVYLPPSYDEGARLPLCMVLPPYAAGHRSLLNYNCFEPDLFERYERLMAQGVREAVLIAPDCMTRWGGSQFIDSSATGAYQTYLAQDVLPFVEARYHTVSERNGRAVIGRSSGGFGALRLMIDRPELFAAYASHAGDACFDVSVRPSFTAVATTLDRAGGLSSFVERFTREGLRSSDFDAIMTIASAAAYSPDPSEPLPHAVLPFEVRTAQIVPEVWERWLAHDPLVRLERDARAGTDAVAIFLDAGDRDEHGLQFAARLMADALRSRGAKVHHEEFAGGHRGTAHRYEASLPFVLAALG